MSLRTRLRSRSSERSDPIEPVHYSGTTVLITGASSGLGEVFAEQFAARGANVVLVARREDRLTALAEKVEATYGVTATVIAQDLSESDAAAQLVSTLRERQISVNSLINNAGFGLFGDLTDTDPERLTQMIDLNVRFLTDLTRLLVPQLDYDGSGVLVNIASNAAFQPIPGMAAYAASKAYVLSFTEALSYELKGTGLKVLALCPGPTKTEFFDDNTSFSVGSQQTADQVVSLAIKELDKARPRPSVVSGKRNALTAKLVGFLPKRVVLKVTGAMSE